VWKGEVELQKYPSVHIYTVVASNHRTWYPGTSVKQWLSKHTEAILDIYTYREIL